MEKKGNYIEIASAIEGSSVFITLYQRFWIYIEIETACFVLCIYCHVISAYYWGRKNIIIIWIIIITTTLPENDGNFTLQTIFPRPVLPAKYPEQKVTYRAGNCL